LARGGFGVKERKGAARPMGEVVVRTSPADTVGAVLAALGVACFLCFLWLFWRVEMLSTFPLSGRLVAYGWFLLLAMPLAFTPWMVFKPNDPGWRPFVILTHLASIIAIAGTVLFLFMCRDGLVFVTFASIVVGDFMLCSGLRLLFRF
jgi:hypothetical protein